jgi:hypothetical protein
MEPAAGYKGSGSPSFADTVEPQTEWSHDRERKTQKPEGSSETGRRGSERQAGVESRTGRAVAEVESVVRAVRRRRIVFLDKLSPA